MLNQIGKSQHSNTWSTNPETLWYIQMELLFACMIWAECGLEHAPYRICPQSDPYTASTHSGLFCVEMVVCDSLVKYMVVNNWKSGQFQVILAEKQNSSGGDFSPWIFLCSSGFLTVGIQHMREKLNMAAAL